jgi:hypothetical protein
MKLIKLNQTQVSDCKEVPGLVNCRIEYEVKTAQGRLDYHGPKFTPELWHQVLSFFRWTHKEMQSECQVRLYVNLKLGRWGAWAFPQEARTGMTARELPVPESVVQAKERFASWQSEPSDDWLYFGTVHHHCSASAFQSSTDEQNEWNQDGLHLTVGKMDAERHDIHARFYLGGNCFEPDLSCFWLLNSELAEQVPPTLHDQLARYQMCAKVTVDFPDVWRANLIESKAAPLSVVGGRSRNWDQDELQYPLEIRLDDALEEIARRCAVLSVQEDQWLTELQSLSASDVNQIIIAACIKYHVTPEDLLAMTSQSTLEYEWPEGRYGF